MRSMSFMLTVRQVKARSKKVTRRLGWRDLYPGTLLKAVEKAQGLKKGERQVLLAVIRTVTVRSERLDRMLTDPEYGAAEVVLEGFPDLTPAQFVDMFCKANACRPDSTVTRIEFDYWSDTLL